LWSEGHELIDHFLNSTVETVGYVGRVLGHLDREAKTPFIIQSLLILVAPALFAATIYMTLGRIIRATHGAKYSFIRLTWMTKIFVVGDVLSFFIQGAGGGIMAGGEADKLELGENIIIGALFLQIVVFGFFILATVIFHYRMRKQPTPQSYNPDLRWEKTIYVLYGISAIITIRNIFRVAEYIGGREGFLLRVEWPIYVFDAVFMAVTMAIFYRWYPRTQQFRIVDSKISVETPPVEIADEFGGLKEGRSSRAGHTREVLH
jgi:RTA1 like protein